MNKKEMLIEYAKEIAEYCDCDKQGECNKNCAFYTKHGAGVCLFYTALSPSEWDFNTVEEN